MSAAAPYRVRVETRFKAAHAAGPGGDSIGHHEHDWTVAVTAEAAALDRIALVVDFRVLLADTEAVLDEVRGRALEDHPDFAAGSATAVDVAAWLLARLDAGARGASYRITSVEVSSDPGISFTATLVDRSG